MFAGFRAQKFDVGDPEIHIPRRVGNGPMWNDEFGIGCLLEHDVHAVEHPPETRQEGDTLVIPIVEEILVVERRLVLKEEVRVRRTEQQRSTRETARLRSEVAEVESIPPGEG